MLADHRVPSSFDSYRLIPLDEVPGPTAGILPAVGDNDAPLIAGKIPADRVVSDLVYASTAGKIPADVSSQHLKIDAAPALTAGKSAAVGGQNASSTAVKMPADLSDQPAQEEARGERKHRKLNIDRSFDTTALQNETQKEDQHTSAILQPSVLNTSTERMRPPQLQPRSLKPEEAEEITTKYCRLLVLQQELALLKKTPSMQLLARQRIPRLEAEIKQLATLLQV